MAEQVKDKSTEEVTREKNAEIAELKDNLSKGKFLDYLPTSRKHVVEGETSAPKQTKGKS